ncbi:hypothetical protein ABK040_012862 [Willaertia magna]
MSQLISLPPEIISLIFSFLFNQQQPLSFHFFNCQNENKEIEFVLSLKLVTKEWKEIVEQSVKFLDLSGIHNLNEGYKPKILYNAQSYAIKYKKREILILQNLQNIFKSFPNLQELDISIYDFNSLNNDLSITEHINSNKNLKTIYLKHSLPFFNKLKESCRDKLFVEKNKGFIYIVTLSGLRWLFPINKDTTVADLKAHIELVFGIRSIQQRLIYSGKLLENEKKIFEDYKLKYGSFIQLLL